MRLTWKESGIACAAMILGVAPAGRASIIPITQDTYVDSTYSVYNGLVVANTQETAFDTYTGGSGSSSTPSNQRIKVVSSSGSTQFPGNSRVHGLFKLPDAFWNEFDAGIVSRAVVSFTLFNNSLNKGNPSDLRDVLLHPMTREWDTQTATWRTYDGVHPWSTTDWASDHDDPATGGGGGDYDAAKFVATLNPAAPSGSLMSWDITPLLSDPSAVDELRNNGALLRVSQESVFNGNRFLSMYSFDAGGSTGPVVTTTIPEPAGAAAALLAGLVCFRRRRAEEDR